MDTLRGFVKAVWTTDESVRNSYVSDQVWSKLRGADVSARAGDGLGEAGAVRLKPA